MIDGTQYRPPQTTLAVLYRKLKEPRGFARRAADEVRAGDQLKTAKQIGLTIPPNVLARANKVIK